LKPIPVVLNPTAGGGRLLDQRLALESAARSCGVELEWWLTEDPGHGEHLGRRAVAAGCPLVLAFGGDGTYNEVARGIAGSATALGVIPGGTTSVLAYELAVPRPAARALRVLLDGRDRTMRLGRTNRGDLFLLMLSAGPDALVVRNLPPSLKQRGGRSGLAVQAVRELLRRRALPQMRVSIDGDGIDAGWVIVGNSRSYAGPFHATPGADPFDDRFEVVVQRRVGRPAAIPFALGIPFGRHVRRRDVVRRNGRRVVIEPMPAAADVPYQVDGDAVGALPVEAWIADQTVTVRLPAGSPWLKDDNADRRR
jgi:diacylglycerol kinase family enzyme